MPEEDGKALKGLVEQAEAATASIRDEELRKIAFSKTLDHLLATRTPSAAAGKTVARPGRRARGTGKKPGPAKKGPMAWLEELVAEGFFKKPKDSDEVLAELESRGHHLELRDIIVQLRRLCQKKLIRRKKAASKDGKRKITAYSNW